MRNFARVQKVRRLLRRILFWLPSHETQGEQPPDAFQDHHLVISVTTPERVPKLRQFRYALRVFSQTERRVIYYASVTAFFAVLISGFIFVNGHIVKVPVAG